MLSVWDYKKVQRMRHCTCEERTPDCYRLCKRPLSCIAGLQEAVSSKPSRYRNNPDRDNFCSDTSRASG